MSDTLGSLIDKLATVNQKMFINQEFIYEVRRMSLEDFLQKYVENSAEADACEYSETKVRTLYEKLQKCCDLNVQRNALISEVDEKIIGMIEQARSGASLDDGRNVQRAHKTG